MTILALLDFLEGSCCLLPQHPGLLLQQLQGPQLPRQECTSAGGGTAVMDLSAGPLLQLFQPGRVGGNSGPHTGMEALERSRLSPLVCGFTSSLHPKEHFPGSTCTSPLTPEGMVSRWDGLGLRSRHSLSRVC